MNHLDSNSILVHYQHGFRQRHPYEMELIIVIESVAGNPLYQYQTGQVPSDWVTANDTPVFKKRNRASQLITDRFL